MRDEVAEKPMRDEAAEKTDAGRVALSLQQLSGAAANLQTLLNRTL